MDRTASVIACDTSRSCGAIHRETYPAAIGPRSPKGSQPKVRFLPRQRAPVSSHKDLPPVEARISNPPVSAIYMELQLLSHHVCRLRRSRCLQGPSLHAKIRCPPLRGAGIAVVFRRSSLLLTFPHDLRADQNQVAWCLETLTATKACSHE